MPWLARPVHVDVAELDAPYWGWSRHEAADQVPATGHFVVFTEDRSGVRAEIGAWATTVNHDIARLTDLPAGFEWRGRYVVGSDTYHVVDSDTYYHCGHCAAAAGTNQSRFVTATFAAPVVILPSLPSEDDDSDEDDDDSDPEHYQTEPTPLAAAHVDALRFCSHCNMPGHRADRCPGEVPVYALLGIEIEGRWRRTAWDDVSNRARRAGHTVTSDGSVNSRPGYAAAEIPTKPQDLRDSLKSLVEFYPHHAGTDCGMHVHVSFHDCTAISRLATPEFLGFFRSRWEAWGRAQEIPFTKNFWHRLRGGNSYCHPMDGRTITEPGFNLQRMDRYHQLNFAAWSEHRTVECRMLPMFENPLLAVRAVEELMSIYQDFLLADQTIASAAVDHDLYPAVANSDSEYDIHVTINSTTDVALEVSTHDYAQLEPELQDIGFRRRYVPTARNI